MPLPAICYVSLTTYLCARCSAPAIIGTASLAGHCACANVVRPAAGGGRRAAAGASRESVGQSTRKGKNVASNSSCGCNSEVEVVGYRLLELGASAASTPSAVGTPGVPGGKRLMIF